MRGQVTIHRSLVCPRENRGVNTTQRSSNSWLSDYGQLRRNTDRKPEHHLAQLALAVAFLLAAKLIDWRTRWSLAPFHIR